MISLPCQRSHCPCGQSLKGIHYLPFCHGTFLEVAISPRGKRDFFNVQSNPIYNGQRKVTPVFRRI